MGKLACEVLPEVILAYGYSNLELAGAGEGVTESISCIYEA